MGQGRIPVERDRMLRRVRRVLVPSMVSVLVLGTVSACGDDDENPGSSGGVPAVDGGATPDGVDAVPEEADQYPTGIETAYGEVSGDNLLEILNQTEDAWQGMVDGQEGLFTYEKLSGFHCYLKVYATEEGITTISPDSVDSDVSLMSCGPVRYESEYGESIVWSSLILNEDDDQEEGQPEGFAWIVGTYPPSGGPSREEELEPGATLYRPDGIEAPDLADVTG